jgi:hypothetical protein
MEALAARISQYAHRQQSIRLIISALRIGDLVVSGLGQAFGSIPLVGLPNNE